MFDLIVWLLLPGGKLRCSPALFFIPGLYTGTIILFFILLLEYHCYNVVFVSAVNKGISCVYTYTLPSWPPFLPPHPTLWVIAEHGWAPCGIQQLPTSYWLCTRQCMWQPLSQFIPAALSHSRAHVSVSYVHISIPAFRGHNLWSHHGLASASKRARERAWWIETNRNFCLLSPLCLASTVWSILGTKTATSWLRVFLLCLLDCDSSY